MSGMINFDKLLGIETPTNTDEVIRIPSPNAHKYRKKYLRTKRNNPISLLFKNAKQRARAKNLEFSITKDDVKMPELCPILGIPLHSNFGGVASDHSPSLDRIDSEKGYVPGNVMIISFRANTLKNNATPDELRKVADFLCKMKA